MNILAIGDVVGSKGCEFVRKKLPNLKKSKNIDLVIANGENSSDGNGITPTSAGHLFDSGVDVITSGNHIYRRPEISEYIEENENLIRPANYPKGAPGNGYVVFDMGRYSVLIINLMGVSFMEPLDCPFNKADEILNKESGRKIVIVDFHAEATGEKKALGYYLDGRVSALFGTHTHIQTADETVFENGTGYITDVGMTGSINSVLGVRSELVIKKLKYKLPVRFDYMQGEQQMDCILFEIDEKTGKCLSVERMNIR